MNNPNLSFKNKTYNERAKRRFEKKLSEGVVCSSNGEITIDLKNGDVIEVSTGNVGFTDWASNVARFDLAEYRLHYGDLDRKDTSFDILDLGFWQVSGKYVPPSKSFRNEIARDFEEDGF